MTKPKNPPLPRRRSGRAAVLAGATLVLALSAGPGAHADSDTGPLDDITQVVGQATQPIVQPVVQSVESAVPQPVQEAVEPVVEQVVEPVPPVAQVVEQVAHPAEGQADDPDDVPAVMPAQGPVRHLAPENAGAAGVDMADVADMAEPAESVGAAHGTAPGGPTGGHAGDGSRHVDALGPAALSCPDLPPRVATTTVVALHGGDHKAPSDHGTVWDVAHALMELWAAGGGSSGEVVSPRHGESDRRASELPRQLPTAVTALGTPSPGPVPGLVKVVGLLGLLGLLGVLAAVVAGARARERG